MSIQAITFKQVGNVVHMKYKQLCDFMIKHKLMVFVEYRQVHQMRGGVKQYYPSSRYDGKYIINGACGKRDDNNNVVPDQLLDSRIVDVMKELLNENLPEISVG
ncbi:hypothetical protein GE278_17550 [Enterobacteriaceae bacterium Kacie_13]|nr:hypothetical protein GE278_17550 [Enterobacteriaceae bacterium Kacie_13]